MTDPGHNNAEEYDVEGSFLDTNGHPPRGIPLGTNNVRRGLPVTRDDVGRANSMPGMGMGTLPRSTVAPRGSMPGSSFPSRGTPVSGFPSLPNPGGAARPSSLNPQPTFPRGTLPPAGSPAGGGNTHGNNSAGSSGGSSPHNSNGSPAGPGAGLSQSSPANPHAPSTGNNPGSPPMTRDPLPRGPVGNPNPATPPNANLSGSGNPRGGAGLPPRANSTPRPQMLASKRTTSVIGSGSSGTTPADFNPLNTTILPKQKQPARLIKFNPEDIVRDKPKLAKGSFGVIYTGHVKGIKEKVVIKDMTNVYPESVEEWKNEIEVMSNNSCDFVCKIFGHSEDQETLSLIVEYMPKGDLFHILHKSPEKHPLSILQRMRMARQTAYGLTFLHSNGLMHRDMKSLNILVTDDYSCKLADFGTAKLITQAQALNTANVGSPLWMAPEVRNGIYGFPADVYSLGLILYEIFSGKMPLFNPTTMTTTLPAQFSYSKLILPCIDKDPTKRPTSFQIGQMLDTMISSIVMSVLNSMKQPGSQPSVERPVDKLCSAAWNNDVPTMKQILNAGNINDKNSRGQCALYCAARQGSVDAMLEILNFGGANVDLQVAEHGGTPLHAASFAEHCDVVALLLAKGATSSISNLKGLSARQEAKGLVQEVYYVFEKAGLEKLKAAYPVVHKLKDTTKETVFHKPLPVEGVPFPELADLEGPQRLEVIYKYILSLPPQEAESLINNAFKIQMMSAK